MKGKKLSSAEMESPVIKGRFEGYGCSGCRKNLHVFVSHGMRGPESDPFTTIQISSCQYCAETNKFRGMKLLLEKIIDMREY